MCRCLQKYTCCRTRVLPHHAIAKNCHSSSDNYRSLRHLLTEVPAEGLPAISRGFRLSARALLYVHHECSDRVFQAFNQGLKNHKANRGIRLGHNNAGGAKSGIKQ